MAEIKRDKTATPPASDAKLDAAYVVRCHIIWPHRS